MKREELRNKYIREICDKNNKALRRLAETNSDDSNYLAELANEEEEKDSMSEHFDAKYTLDDLLEKSQGENPTANAWETDKIKPRVGFKRLSDDAILPTKAHPSDSGYDIYAAEDVIIEPGETVIVPTGIAVELPPGYEAQIRPRSGVTAKTKLRVQLGTIDNGYRGELGVIVDNTFTDIYAGTDFYMKRIDGSKQRIHGDVVEIGTYKIRKGDRIAQLVIQRLPETEAVEIDEFSEGSERGAGGFGSSGV